MKKVPSFWTKYDKTDMNTVYVCSDVNKFHKKKHFTGEKALSQAEEFIKKANQGRINWKELL